VAAFDRNHWQPFIGISGRVCVGLSTKYNDGNSIPNITDNTKWKRLKTGAYCFGENDISNKTTYGALYNWFAVNTGKLCPVGWHVPGDSEWTTLIDFLGGESVAAGKMKEKGTAHWISPNTYATNISGFSALPGGCRSSNKGTFFYIGFRNYWWSSTEGNTNCVWDRSLHYYYGNVYRSSDNKEYGLSVRCVRDN
jgi:uncharacterized protein (TIGR02145 family)